jgi:hypothetical protein
MKETFMLKILENVLGKASVSGLTLAAALLVNPASAAEQSENNATIEWVSVVDGSVANQADYADKVLFKANGRQFYLEMNDNNAKYLVSLLYSLQGTGTKANIGYLDNEIRRGYYKAFSLTSAN